MKKAMIVVVIAVLALAILGRAKAQQVDNWRQSRRARFFTRHMVHELNLTDGQRESIKAILQKEKPEIQSIATELMQENAQLRTKSTFDEAFVRSVAQQRNGTLTEALVEKEKIRSQIFALLTAEQQQKLNQMADDVRATIQDRIATLGDQL